MSNQFRKSNGCFLNNPSCTFENTITIVCKKFIQNIFPVYVLRRFHEKKPLKKWPLVADLLSTTLLSHLLSISFVTLLTVPCNTS